MSWDDDKTPQVHVDEPPTIVYPPLPYEVLGAVLDLGVYSTFTPAGVAMAEDEVPRTPPKTWLDSLGADLKRLTCDACNAEPNMIGPKHTCEQQGDPTTAEARKWLKAGWVPSQNEGELDAPLSDGGVRASGGAFGAFVPRDVYDAVVRLHDEQGSKP